MIIGNNFLFSCILTLSLFLRFSGFDISSFCWNWSCIPSAKSCFFTICPGQLRHLIINYMCFSDSNRHIFLLSTSSLLKFSFFLQVHGKALQAPGRAISVAISKLKVWLQFSKIKEIVYKYYSYCHLPTNFFQYFHMK